MTSAPAEPTTGLDYVELIRFALNRRDVRREAWEIFRATVEGGLLLHDDGAHPRISDVGRCSLEFVTGMRDMHDLERPLDVQLLMLDQGTLSGAWNAALLAAALPGRVKLEHQVTLRGVPGHIDALVDCGHPSGAKWYTLEPVEFKLSQTGGQLRSPKEAGKLYQIAQAGMYTDGVNEAAQYIAAESFVIVTGGPNVGSNKYGVPYPKMRQDRYFVADFRNEIDGEIERLRTLGALDSPSAPLPPADAKEEWRCASCCFSACERNRNSQRLML